MKEEYFTTAKGGQVSKQILLALMTRFFLADR